MSLLHPMDVQALIGWNVARLRRVAGLTQEELAHRVEVVAQTYVSNLEAGKHNPTAVTLYLLARALGANPGDLYQEVGAPKKILDGPVIIRSARSGKHQL